MNNPLASQPTILILGGSGYVGRHLFAKLGSDRAVATYYRNPMESGVYFDSLTMSLNGITELPASISHALVLLGNTKPESCAADTGTSRSLNVDSIKSILDQLRSRGIKPVFTSTESVFDGAKGDYVESDPANPILVYGQQKVEIENYIQEKFDGFIIVRLGLTFGSTLGDGTIFDNWLRTIQNGQAIHCAHDQVCSPIYIEDVVEAITRLIDQDCNGIFHLCSHKPYSKLQLGEILLANLTEYVSGQPEVIRRSIHDFEQTETKPLNVSMKPDKLVKATGVNISDIEAVCKHVVKNRFASAAP